MRRQGCRLRSVRKCLPAGGSNDANIRADAASPRVRQPLIECFGLFFGQHFAGIELGDAGLDLGDLPFVQLDIRGNGFCREVRLRALGGTGQCFKLRLKRRINPRRYDRRICYAHLATPPDDSHVYNRTSALNHSREMTNTLRTLHDPAAAARYYAAGLWRLDTLYTLLVRHAARRPERFALRDGTHRLSWAALLKLVDAIAADLDAAGLNRGRPGG